MVIGCKLIRALLCELQLFVRASLLALKDLHLLFHVAQSVLQMFDAISFRLWRTMREHWLLPLYVVLTSACSSAGLNQVARHWSMR